MIKLDDDLLQELGLAALPPEEKKKLLAHIYETLEMRVGMKLANRMTDAQLTEFEQFIDRSDEPGALKWLETHFPDYKDVVASEFERLKAEIRQVSPQILSAGQQQSSAQQPDTTYERPGQPGQPPQGAGAWPASGGSQPYDGHRPGAAQEPGDPWAGQGGSVPPPPPPPPSPESWRQG